jgi:acetyltransferase-like isoleucine patch superfamily enzyme
MLVPGSLGMALRARVIPRYFKRCGTGIQICEGVRFRGIELLAVGNDVRIGYDNFIQASGGVRMGNDVMLGPGVKIWSVNHKYDETTKPIAEQGYDYSRVDIGDGVWIGANSFVLPGTQIPEGCVVSAGSVVNKKAYKPYALIAGNPCRMIGYRKGKDDKLDSRIELINRVIPPA